MWLRIDRHRQLHSKRESGREPGSQAGHSQQWEPPCYTVSRDQCALHTEAMCWNTLCWYPLCEWHASLEEERKLIILDRDINVCGDLITTHGVRNTRCTHWYSREQHMNLWSEPGRKGQSRGSDKIREWEFINCDQMNCDQYIFWTLRAKQSALP